MQIKFGEEVTVPLSGWGGGHYRVQELYAGTFPDTCESVGDETAVNSRLGEREKGRR